MNWLNYVDTIVGVVGVIVGIIGLKSISVANKIKNTVNAKTVQQAQIINNGLDNYAVIRLAKDTTKDELERIIAELPKIHVGSTPPNNPKSGDIWIDTSE